MVGRATQNWRAEMFGSRQKEFYRETAAPANCSSRALWLPRILVAVSSTERIPRNRRRFQPPGREPRRPIRLRRPRSARPGVSDSPLPFHGGGSQAKKRNGFSYGQARAVADRLAVGEASRVEKPETAGWGRASRDAAQTRLTRDE